MGLESLQNDFTGLTPSGLQNALESILGPSRAIWEFNVHSGGSPTLRSETHLVFPIPQHERKVQREVQRNKGKEAQSG